MARTYGSNIPHLGEAQKRTEDMRRQYGNKPGFATGGRVHSYPDMKYGAANGMGRLEKVAAYGDKAKKK